MKTRRLRVDPGASHVSLEASQLGLLKHRCRFTRFQGNVSLAGERSVATAELRIRASSLSSAFGRALDRVAALVLLEADRHPWVTVHARDLHLAGGSGRVLASLTLRGRTAQVPLQVTIDEQGTDGSVRFSVEARVDRREWGVAESLPGVRLGNQISIRAAVRAVPA